MGIFIFIILIISLISMQFLRNFFDIWLTRYLIHDPIFEIVDFKTTILILASCSIIVTLIRSFVFAFASLSAARNIYDSL